MPQSVLKALLLAGLCSSNPLLAQEEPAAGRQAEPSETVVTIRMKDGSTLVARILDQDEKSLKIVTVSGLKLEIPRSSVESMEAGRSSSVRAQSSDPNYSRLLFSPTGRTLAKGDGYFSNHYVMFPGVAYGITNNLSVGAGVSVVPGVGLGDQLFYVAPRLGARLSERVAVSGGYLFARAGDSDEDANLGLGFAVATFGGADKSITTGIGVARTVEHHYDNGSGRSGRRREVSHTPILMVGGTAKLSRRIAFVSESWLIKHDDFKLSEQPFGLGLRFFGDRLSADVGVLLIGEVLKEGFPVPWLSVSYHFGRARNGKRLAPTKRLLGEGPQR